MSFKLNAIALASLSILLAACGGSSDSNNTTSNSNTSSFFSTDWFYVSLFSYSSRDTTDNTGTIYTYDIRSEAYNYNKTSNLISYTIETLVDPTSYHDKKSGYIATSTQLLTVPATIGTTGIPDSFLINESDNSITMAPYNQEGIKTAALTKVTFKKVDLSNTLISDLIKQDISFFKTLSADTNPHYLKAKATGLKFPTGSMLLEQTQIESFEDAIGFGSLSSFSSIVSYKTGTTLPIGASFSDSLWANGKVKSACIVTTTGSRSNCVAEYDGKLYSADYISKEVITDPDNLEAYWHINKTAADALAKAYKDNFKSETIAKTTNEAAAK